MGMLLQTMRTRLHKEVGFFPVWLGAGLSIKLSQMLIQV